MPASLHGGLRHRRHQYCESAPPKKDKEKTNKKKNTKKIQRKDKEIDKRKAKEKGCLPLSMGAYVIGGISIVSQRYHHIKTVIDIFNVIFEPLVTSMRNTFIICFTHAGFFSLKFYIYK